MEIKSSALKTFYPSDEKNKMTGRYTAIIGWRNEENIKVTPIRASRNLMIEQNKLVINLENNKDFGVNTNTQILNQKNFQFANRELKSTPRKISSLSPDPLRNYSPKLISIELEQEPKFQKYPVYPKTIKINREKISVSPRLNFAEITANLPRQDGKNLIVHKYALPQALIPIRTFSPAPKVPNILEEKTLPRPHPIIRKGFSGWKISFKKLMNGQIKKKNLTMR